MAAHAIPAHVRVERSTGEAPLVRGNAARLGQVVLNVVVNAAHAMQGVHDRPCVLGVAVDAGAGGGARIAIRDSGRGIPKEALGRVFEPFFTTKPAGVGTGLGLAICHRIVQSHGGEIAFESEVGTGTTVTISLPAAEPRTLAPRSTGIAVPSSDVALEPASAAMVSRPALLVVDDEPDIVDMIEELVTDEFRVSAASSGHEALARIEEEGAFDVVLCDMVMPKMSGLALHAEVARAHPETAARFVFMTGGPLRREEAALLRERSLTHLYKPLDVATLQKRLAEVARRTRATSGVARTA
jgi:CheY-like chemotaxis protein